MKLVGTIGAVILACVVSFGALAEAPSASIEQDVTDILVESLGADRAEVLPDARLDEDLGADDLDLVEIVIRCEEKFDLSISDEDFDKVSTVRDLSALVARLKSRH